MTTATASSRSRILKAYNHARGSRFSNKPDLTTATLKAIRSEVDEILDLPTDTDPDRIMARLEDLRDGVSDVIRSNELDRL